MKKSNDNSLSASLSAILASGVDEAVFAGLEPMEDGEELLGTMNDLERAVYQARTQTGERQDSLINGSPFCIKDGKLVLEEG